VCAWLQGVKFKARCKLLLNTGQMNTQTIGSLTTYMARIECTSIIMVLTARHKIAFATNACASMSVQPLYCGVTGSYDKNCIAHKKEVTQQW
jgi:hypothetical protein